ncbi:hypothetical protein ALSL_0771 [Aerosticca soli]|uniref:Uncharacterized protein n=1 Tax=Aerosticca soli TaxID=2010829 RepID=A0A2Z6E3A1_9GAMM|nr:hypothetical protein ALSL_0771 [Aerosticca soli]
MAAGKRRAVSKGEHASSRAGKIGIVRDPSSACRRGAAIRAILPRPAARASAFHPCLRSPPAVLRRVSTCVV